MNKVMRKDTEFEIKSLKYLIKRLRVLEHDITKTVEKEKATRKTQIENLSELKISANIRQFRKRKMPLDMS